MILVQGVTFQEVHVWEEQSKICVERQAQLSFLGRLGGRRVGTK